ncbi:hypothetical protein NKV53_00240 [Legionella sp. 27cVA30]|uniref:hypothetical protein n=1 Tax=Legionella TaxID=445 RepID=UPI000F8E2517|nr:MULTISPECIES: hypothetical protein [Legionella]MCP0912813.1 hypothetical protein [Legionella sp. 27cVA30]RUR16296.1 hypothetical protein ELY10_03635 [Legionella septentrionalis]
MKLVALSEKSQELIGSIRQQTISDSETQQDFFQPFGNKEKIFRHELVAWLKTSPQYPVTLRYKMESLRAALLEDLHGSFFENEEIDNTNELPAPWYNKVQFVALLIAGTVLAICEGFDGIAAILGMFEAVPSSVIFIAGLAFSFLSVVVFYGFDLLAISSNLGVKLQESSQLIDVFLRQIEQIKLLRKKIDEYYPKVEQLSGEDALNELNSLKEMIAMLKHRYKSMDEAREIYKTRLHAPHIRIMKLVIAAVTGVLFFGGGFFAGQSLAMAIAGFFVASVAPTFWPILLVSVAVGLAALYTYWFIERPGLENLVGRWFGLDQEKIDALADEAITAHQLAKLEKLERKLDQQINHCQEVSTLKQTIQTLTPTETPLLQSGNEQRGSNVIPLSPRLKGAGFFNPLPNQEKTAQEDLSAIKTLQ